MLKINPSLIFKEGFAISKIYINIEMSITEYLLSPAFASLYFGSD
jgi:hypothetical protein